MVVASEHGLRKILIPAHQRVQAVADHCLRQLAHAREIDIGLHLRVPQNPHRRLRYIHGLIADSLQVLVDSRYRQQKPQVRRHRLLQREQPLHAVVDLDLHFVDGALFGEYGVGEILLRVQHRVNGLMNSAFGQAAHPKQPLLELFQIVFEVSFHVSSECRWAEPDKFHYLSIIRNGR